MTSPPLTIVLDDKRQRFASWLQKLQHAVGGVPLLLAGVHHWQSPGGSGDVLAMAEIIMAAILLVLLARDLRSAAKATSERTASAAAHESTTEHVHTGPEWVDVVAGTLLIIDAAHRVHPGGKPLYAHATFVTGVVTSVIGLLHGRISRLASKRRQIQFDDAGVRVRLSRFRRFTVAWTDVREIRITTASIVIDAASGSHTISLGRYRNAMEIRTAFEQWSVVHALPHAS